MQEDDGYEEAVREHNIFGIWLDKEGIPNAQQPEPTPEMEVWSAALWSL